MDGERRYVQSSRVTSYLTRKLNFVAKFDHISRLSSVRKCVRCDVQEISILICQQLSRRSLANGQRSQSTKEQTRVQRQEVTEDRVE